MKQKRTLFHAKNTGRLAVIAVMVALNLILVALVGFWFRNRTPTPPVVPLEPESTATALDLSTAVPVLPNQLELAAPALPTLPPGASLHESISHSGLLVLSMADGYHNHLFAYHPQYLPLTRLTNEAFDDITPAVSPDGKQIAFSSRRNGYWDLYLYDLSTQTILRLTDTYDYDGAPAWSPDSKWLAYETYLEGSLEIMLLSMEDPTSVPIRITDDPAADYAPAWSPRGRQLAFVSQRSGEPEIWLAALDESVERFSNISREGRAQEDHPEWSPDGRYLVWGAATEGDHALMLWDSENPSAMPLKLGSGYWPVWSPLGDSLATALVGANETTLGGYNLRQRAFSFPAERLPGSLFGLDWAGGSFADAFLTLTLPENATQPGQPLWAPQLGANPQPPAGRFGLVPLPEVTAPFPFMADLADESFAELRKFTALQAGWDFLSSLENAYLPLSEPPTLAAQENWLYTGRAFAFNPVSLNAGWLCLAKEQVNGLTYWRVFLKTRFQDGSQGMPLTTAVWNINARYNNDPQSYEQGGQPAPVPGGYWVDFTDLAARYSWERLPAQLNWRTFISAARFNQFVLASGLDWRTAMGEIFPVEALSTPTSAPSLTPMPSSTPQNTNWSFYTPTPTAAPTLTPQPRPTWTPLP